MVGFPLGMYLFGFLVAMPVFNLAYMRTHGARWLAAIAVTILLPAVMWAMLELLLKVELYRGLFFGG